MNAPPAGWHDAAACLVDGSGNVIAYSEQERHNRVRHAIGDGFNKPVGAARFCLDQAGITLDDIDVIAVGWNVDQMFPGFFADERELATHATGFDFPGRLPRIVRVPHHEAHAASAFYASPFSEAGVLVIDGNGENESTSIWSFSYGRAPELKRAWPRTASLGYAYDGASEWLGFHHLNAGKTMGLAAYGRAQGLSVETLLDVDGGDLRPAVPSLPESHGQATIDEIGRHYGATVAAWRDLYSKLAGADGPTVPVHRLPEDPAAVLVAYTAQRLIEDAVTSLASTARGLAGVEELCLAGGVALNCSANGVLPGPVFVPPVPHDAGVALGAAWTVCPPKRTGEAMSPYLGEDVRAPGAEHPEMSGLLRTDFDADQVTDLLLDGQVGAVARGRAEIGPRALCHRSILAVPDTADVHARVNRIKHRERWRPFAGVTFAEYGAGLWERQEHLSRYMLGAARVTDEARRVAPGVVHVDGTTRPQVLASGAAPAVEAVLEGLAGRGAPPVLLNTSFNDKGEPIVNSATDALAAFRSMDLDFLVLDQALYRKASRAR
ncbi:carbamoyltransferase C-terminal domain-containing protein [Streptomyces phaeoluteigriseus]|uniref:carbamoyltransferase C-terminal domain-containing protein n=1 Tax=Streptomyces phaeoluteigriseus TaxID=114686 RepID=UPI00368FB76D